MADTSKIVPAAAPLHVGIIMDGSGRWALQRGLPRTKGHEEGLNAAKRIAKAAINIGIRYLSLYTFSTENWQRSFEEIRFLMAMIGTHLRKEYDFYHENRIRVLHSGNMQGLSAYICRELDLVQQETREFDRLTINLAINYGGRDEIVRAVRRWNANGSRHEEITEDTIQRYMDLPGLPDPDLIIRSGGEQRLSNFMLWGCAYAELIFSTKLWPDWETHDMRSAVQEFQRRKRNFGRERRETPYVK